MLGVAKISMIMSTSVSVYMRMLCVCMWRTCLYECVCVYVCVCGIRVVFACNFITLQSCFCFSLSTSGSRHQTLSGISHSIG